VEQMRLWLYLLMVLPPCPLPGPSSTPHGSKVGNISNASIKENNLLQGNLHFSAFQTLTFDF
jgi:hypothetical protein